MQVVNSDPHSQILRKKWPDYVKSFFRHKLTKDSSKKKGPSDRMGKKGSTVAVAVPERGRAPAERGQTRSAIDFIRR